MAFLMATMKCLANATQEGRVSLGPQFEGAIHHHSEEGTGAEAGGSWSCRFCSQEAERDGCWAPLVFSHLHTPGPKPMRWCGPHAGGVGLPIFITIIWKSFTDMPMGLPIFWELLHPVKLTV